MASTSRPSPRLLAGPPVLAGARRVVEVGLRTLGWALLCVWYGWFLVREELRFRRGGRA